MNATYTLNVQLVDNKLASMILLAVIIAYHRTCIYMREILHYSRNFDRWIGSTVLTDSPKHAVQNIRVSNCWGINNSRYL